MGGEEGEGGELRWSVVMCGWGGRRGRRVTVVGGDVGGEEGEGGELRWSVVMCGWGGRRGRRVTVVGGDVWVGRKEREESYGGRW